MKFKYYRISNLPSLSWCAVAPIESSEVYVYHGDGVEAFENYFVEGAWDGDFCSGDFAMSEFFVGSGGVKSEQHGVIFATSSHTHERLHSVSNENATIISNSLPFVLFMSESELDPDYIHYESDFNSILKGINNYIKELPLKGGKRLCLHYYCNILLKGNGKKMVELQKKNVKPFTSYNDYESRLLRMLKNIVANAQSPERKVKYGLVTTISRGYDAPACAAMAFEVGCNKAVTFNRPSKYKDDCGGDIAIRLGYKNIIKKSADDYLKNTSLIEAELVSSGALGNGIISSVFENEFQNNIVFVGNRGGIIWGRARTDYNNEFRFDNIILPHTYMIEHRLRTGYIILPMALFGASQWESIHRISNSAEMEAYSVGGNYDRPIPRRMLETRNVDRGMFAVKKSGAGFNYRFDNLSRIKKRMSDKSFESFYAFYKNNKRNNLKFYSESYFKIFVKFLLSKRKSNKEN